MKIKDRLYISTFSNDSYNIARKYDLGLEINHTCISSELDDISLLLTKISNNIKDNRKLLLHGPFTEIHPAAIDHRIKEAGMVRLNEAYEVVKYFNIPKMIVHTGWLPFIYFKSYQSTEASKFFTKFMEGKEFTLAIENVLEDEPYMLKDMMDQIYNPNIKLCIDIGHLNVMTKEDDVYRWIDVLSKYITHFHLHNNFGDNDSHGNFYEGDMDIKHVVECIENVCENVTYTIESHDAKGSIEYLLERGLI